MKALVYTGPKTLELQEKPEPSAGPGDVGVRVDAVGICGSDMHGYLGHDARRPAPLILGHEAAGTVVETGDGAAEWCGKRVTINPLVSCGKCSACLRGQNNICPNREILSMPPREGAFADYVAIPASNIVAVPDDISAEQACLVEPIACGWHAVKLAQKMLSPLIDEARCAVLGGGAIGMGAALSLRAQCARDITIYEPNALRWPALRAEGFAVNQPAKNTALRQTDLVIDAVGYAATRDQACALAAPGAVIAHIGLGEATGGLDPRYMTLQEVTFIGTYTYTPEDFHETAKALFAGELGALEWVDRRKLAEGAVAFDDLLKGASPAPKIVLIP